MVLLNHKKGKGFEKHRMNEKEMELQQSNTLSDEDTEEYLRTALKAGTLALGSGAETARSNTIVQKILESSGSKDYVSTVISKSIIASLNGKTEMARVANWSTNLNKISASNEISKKIEKGELTIRQAKEKLDELEHTTIYNFLLRLLAFVAVTVSMPILLNGTVVDCAAATVCGVIMAFLDALFRRIRIHEFASIVAQTFIMITIGGLAAFLTGGRIILDIIMTAAITPLFPGLALTNAVRDTLQGDYVSGAGRLLEAGVKALAISFGSALGLLAATFLSGSLVNRMFDSPYGIIADNAAIFWIYAGAALIYSAGYCVLFEVTPKFLIWGALVGCIGKTLGVYIVYHTEKEILGAFIATVVTAILAQILSRIFNTPAIPFLIAGIMALVPGRLLSNSISLLISGSFAEGGTKLLNTLMIAGSIAVAIFLVDTIFLTAHRIKNKKLMKES